MKQNTFILILIIIIKEDTIMMLAYSDRKISTKPIEPYSILNPETNSDSPSAKSKGVRYVSAINLTVISITTKGIIKSKGYIDLVVEYKEIELIITITLISNKAKEISYEIVWATPRILPNIAYLLLDAHPHHSTG